MQTKKFKSKEKRKHTDATERVGSMVKLSKLISYSKDVPYRLLGCVRVYTILYNRILVNQLNILWKYSSWDFQKIFNFWNQA